MAQRATRDPVYGQVGAGCGLIVWMMQEGSVTAPHPLFVGIRAAELQRPLDGIQRERWLGWILTAVVVLNGVDALFTLFWVSSGYADEANPLLADLVTGSPTLFVLVKMALVGLGATLLWRRRENLLSVAAILMAFLVYATVFVYHLSAVRFLFEI